MFNDIIKSAWHTIHTYEKVRKKQMMKKVSLLMLVVAMVFFTNFLPLIESYCGGYCDESVGAYCNVDNDECTQCFYYGPSIGMCVKPF